MADWRNRIVAYGEEDPEQLLANPYNWRVHPQHQQAAFLGVVHDVGVVQNIIVNKATGHVVDGHMRVLLAIKEGQRSIPITYVDLSEQEEAEILATYDPISAMAVADRELFAQTLRQFNTGAPAIQELASKMASDLKLIPQTPPEDFTEYGETIETQYCCPKCGYRWSGKPDAEA